MLLSISLHIPEIPEVRPTFSAVLQDDHVQSDWMTLLEMEEL